MYLASGKTTGHVREIEKLLKLEEEK